MSFTRTFQAVLLAVMYARTLSASIDTSSYIEAMLNPTTSAISLPPFTITPPSSSTTITANLTTSTVYATKIYTISSCAPEVTNCPYGHLTTEMVSLYITVCPLTLTTQFPSGLPPPITELPLYANTTSSSIVLPVFTNLPVQTEAANGDVTTVVVVGGSTDVLVVVETTKTAGGVVVEPSATGCVGKDCGVTYEPSGATGRVRPMMGALAVVGAGIWLLL